MIYNDAVEELKILDEQLRSQWELPPLDMIDMATNSYFTQGTTGEQDLVEDLVIEQIKMFGKDVYYIPRTLVNEDTVFGEDSLSAFNGAHLIEAYIEDASGFRGDGDMFSKFGIRISDQVTFIISRKRFTEAVDDNATLIVEGRPNEGDLIHFPLANKTFEIQFVEHEVPFYQLGKIHVWGLRCELFDTAMKTSTRALRKSMQWKLTLQMQSQSPSLRVGQETLPLVRLLREYHKRNCRCEVLGFLYW